MQMSRNDLDAQAVPVPSDRNPHVLVAEDLRRDYRVSRGFMRGSAVVNALNGVSFTLARGQTLAIVGESGCGKSTLARALTMVERPTGGSLKIHGVELATAPEKVIKKMRTAVQMVFQNPYASLNPRKTIGSILAEPLVINTALNKVQRRAAVHAVLAKVGLRPEHERRYPHMFSGGQRQRIAIARALVLGPQIIVADEPTSALDVSIQAQILNLFMDLQADTGVGYVFISHNLSVVEHIAERVMVMYLGSVVECADKVHLFAQPLHPYTKALLSATPSIDPAKRMEKIRIVGELPSPLKLPSGCTFHQRCPYATARCSAEVPVLRGLAGRKIACHHAEEINPTIQTESPSHD